MVSVRTYNMDVCTGQNPWICWLLWHQNVAPRTHVDKWSTQTDYWSDTYFFFPLQSFFHSIHHSSVWKDWVLQANRLIVSNCWQFFLTVQLHPPICLSIQCFWSSWMGFHVFLFVWYDTSYLREIYNVSYLCNTNVLYLCDITFYILPAVNSVRLVDRVPGIILLGRSGVKRGLKNSLCVKVWCHCDHWFGMSVMVFPSHRAGCPHGGIA